MTRLKTTYMGIELKNPLIIGACNLTLDVDVAKRMEDAGAAAIVFKSLFEEQINLESLQMEEDLAEYAERNAEMVSLFPSLEHAGPQEHLDKLSELKASLDIPVIGSLNCVNHPTWVHYAKEVEKTGVDALELNFYANPRDKNQSAETIEKEQLDILKEVKSNVKIPVSVKLSFFYTNPLQIINQMDKLGVDGFVLFNRLFQPDIDTDKQDMYSPFNLSSAGDYKLPLRYAGLLYKQIKGDICSNTGILNGEDLVRVIMAGARVAQVVSAIYKNKIPYIADMIAVLEQWMEQNNYQSLDDFRGKVSKLNTRDPYAYRRAQYVDLLMKPVEVMKRYPQV
ncbi:MAG: dihydroorotate dehydrogenase-like protein [Bacteroidetes bacterium]|nr:MAG: dihydroorotate dehydrogenase-like protein [Bacteroidota bacterium]